jgi:hypothetical protein
VRDLTSAEYRTVLALLSLPNATERERIRTSGLPTSTYNVVHRRLFEEGWLADLLVPNPGPCGFAAVEFRLSRPPLDHRARLLREGTNDPECVLLWSGVHAVFSVHFRARGARPLSLKPSFPDSSSGLRLLASANAGSVPVYFDYAGAWSRFGNGPVPSAYPRGLDLTSSPSGARVLAEARSVFDPGSRTVPRDVPRPNPSTIARTHPRLWEDRLLETRSVLRQARVPPFQGQRIGEVIFVIGRLRAVTDAHRLLNGLVQDCGVSPFLFAESVGTILLAGLGRTSAEFPGRVPVDSAARSVMALLNDHLDHAEVMIEPVEALEEVVDHRYFLPAAPPRADP